MTRHTLTLSVPFPKPPVNIKEQIVKERGTFVLGLVEQRLTGSPPRSETTFRRASAKKPTNWLSGENKGDEASSVPGLLKALAQHRQGVHLLSVEFRNFVLRRLDVDCTSKHF